MKKLLAVVLAGVFAPCVFAGQNAAVSAFEKAVEKQVLQAGMAQQEKIVELKKEVLQSVEDFARFAHDVHYSNWSFLFQGMDQVRVKYMALRALSLSAARELAPEVNRAIKINEGSAEMHIADYVRMEACMLANYSASEELRWEEFGEALSEDLKANK